MLAIHLFAVIYETKRWSADCWSATAPNAVIHFAAETHVDRSIVQPADFVDTNVVGTCRLLDSVKQYWDQLSSSARDAFRFLHVSTDEVFGSLGSIGQFTETTPYAPRSPYSASKAAADHFVRAYWHTYGLPILITNSSNNYGPYQYPEKLIPLTILNALRNRPLTVYGDGSNVRDWIHVEDHCRAVRLVLQAGTPGEAYNVGSDTQRCNLEVVTKICEFVDQQSPCSEPDRSRKDLISFVADRPGHDFRYAIDASKIRSDLGWQPEVDFDTGLEATVRWYLNNMNWVEQMLSER
jgi:dTDP-glucose 4,6-dehydratase